MKIYEMRAPSIWVVRVFDAQDHPTRMGSAVVIGPETLVTNCHVLVRGKSISVKHDNTAHGARLEYADVDRDLCIIKAKGLVAPAVPVAPLSTLKVGEKVYALGAPRGLELTLSDGLLAALHRDKDNNIVRIQMTAPISPGSSGGGLFDEEGRLIGVSYMTIRDAQNLNFAIPATWIDQVPARATVALQKFRAEQAATTAGNATTAAVAPARVPPTGPEQSISGDELNRHFASIGRIVATAPSGAALEMQFSPDGSFGVTNTRTRGYSSGQFNVTPGTDEVCFTMGNPSFNVMQTCYRLSHRGDTYTMRSVSSSYYFTYAYTGS
ncbi:serine protease [Cupriavidus sp. WKF15]|uniref:S1C family serine protease n=1 Tax=Cupriavidus sp. WKF15 TaxID=3032282 RepID=UPI0023E14945|nr:serine protease [Cupriavidus sp. WKF15]WER48669.1 serine protease [Cupriavidus sp. WKF15]